MERATTKTRAGTINLTDATSPRSFKCSKCGNMFAVGDRDEAVCDVCGNRCTTQTCAVVFASDEDY